MSAPNGHAHKDHAPGSGPEPAIPASGVLPISAERIKELVSALEVPFDPSQIEWRVMNATKNQQPMRGQVVPYADQRAYSDRLNALFTQAGRANTPFIPAQILNEAKTKRLLRKCWSRVS